MESDILDSLEQLGYGGPLREEKALLAAAEGGLSSQEFADLCRFLASGLRPLCGLEESAASGPDDAERLRAEVGGVLRELHCPHEEAAAGVLRGAALSAADRLKLVLFLSSELQAARIVRSKEASDKRRGEGPEMQELASICETLDLDLDPDPDPSESGGRSAARVFSQVQTEVEETLKHLPQASVGNPVLKKPLSSDQWEKLYNINAVLSSEYECRRRMLIKRLDVTVQSFGWSDRAKAMVDSMARAYQPKRHSLTPQPTVDMAKLLAAREDICNVVKTSSGSSREKTACAVNKVLMGRVPDRGGRPSEIEAPPPEMPPWQKRQDGGGGWGGRGGGRGGGWGQGGGWGGGGGWRGGGWNQGRHSGHGGKRGLY